jgi:hypothetical protein
MKPIVFVHSNGRSGTEYLRNLAGALNSGRVEIWHERLIGEAYGREFFRRYDDGALDELRARPAMCDMGRKSETGPLLEV